MIPYLDLRRQYESIKNEIDDAISSVFKSGIFILGENVQKFEKNFSSYCNKKYGVTAANGTEALSLALMATGIKSGDEVITACNTAVPTVAAIEIAGAKPVLADSSSYTIDLNLLKKRITKKTKAIIPVHLYGNVCEMDTIIEFANANNLSIIEDCCQAHGAEYKKKRVPVHITGCFSFYPTKNLGAYGDGGMVITNDEYIAENVKLLRNYGEVEKYKNKVPGLNSRLDEIQAAILNVKLKHLDKWNKRRIQLAKLYNDLLSETDTILPEKALYTRHVHHLYVIRHKKRDKLRKYLTSKGIGTQIHYPTPIHLQEAYKHLGYKKGDFPVTEKITKEILSLPLYPELKDNEVQDVCKNIIRFIKNKH